MVAILMDQDVGSGEKKLQELATSEQLTITVAHSPPATSKWNTIEHQLFSFISHQLESYSSHLS